MAIEVYHLPPGSHPFRRELLLRLLTEAEGSDFSHILALTPTRLLRDAWLEEFHNVAGDCYIPPRVMTLRQAVRWTLSEGGDRLIVPSELTPLVLQGTEGWSTGRSVAVSSFIKEMKSHFPMSPLASATRALEACIGELDIAEQVADRITESLAAFGRYQDTLAAGGAMDEEDALLEASRLVTEIHAPHVLILDGFYEMTPAEQTLATAFIRRAPRTICMVPISHDNDDLSYCYASDLKLLFNFESELVATKTITWNPYLRKASSQEDELAGVARLIKSRFLSGQQRNLRDIHLVLPSIKGYRETIERVFASYGLPVRFASGTPLSRTLPYSDLLALVDAVADAYPRLLFSRVLTSTSFRNIPEALRQSVPHLALDASLVEGRAAWVRAFKRYGLAKQGGWVLKMLRPLELMGKGSSFSEMGRALLVVIRRLGFDPSDGAPADLQGLLRPLALMDRLACSPQDLRSFGDSLRRLLERTCVDSGADGVVVAELPEVRGLEPRCLYLCGLRDSEFPAKPPLDLLLPESIRRALGLSDLRRHMRLQEHIFRRLTRSADRLYLSFPAAEGDSVVLPSIFLAGLEARAEDPVGLFNPEEAQSVRPGQPLATRITDIRECPPRGSRSLSVTHVDAYRSCPRRFFIEKILCLKPPELVDFELEPLTVGTLMHRVMERLIPQVLQNARDFEMKAVSVLEDVLAGEPMDPYFKALIRESFLRMAPRIFGLEESIRKEGYAFHAAEADIRGEPLPGIRLRGKVDRIDRTPGGGLAIMDYKTGGGNLSGAGVRNKGAALQLPLYAALLSAQGEEPERVGLYSLRDLTIKWLPGRRDLSEGLTLKDFTKAALVYLRETAEGMLRGHYPALPLEDHVCRNCHERPYCPYIQRGRLGPEAP